MFGTKDCKRCGVENRPEQNQLVQSSRILPIAADKNHDQPDGKNCCKVEIRPFHFAGKREESHDRQRIHNASAHGESFPRLLWNAFVRRILLLFQSKAREPTNPSAFAPSESGSHTYLQDRRSFVCDRLFASITRICIKMLRDLLALWEAYQQRR